MYPILFEIGPFRVYSFGVMAAIGFLFVALWLRETARREKFYPSQLLDLSLGLFVSGLIGSRLLFVALNLDWYRVRPLEIFQLQRGGLVAYGGILATLLFGIFFTRWKRMPFWEVADLLMPLGLLGLAFGRIGCFLNGCCYGKPTSFFLARVFWGKQGPVHPTQIYESWGLLLLFIALRVVGRKSLAPGRLFALSIGGYGLLRFVIEFFRGDQLPWIGGLTLVQAAALATIAAAAWIWYLRKP